MKNNNALSAYLRITLSGFDVEVRTAPNKFRVLLKRGEENVAILDAPRGGGMSAQQALTKVRLNTWGPKSGFHEVMTRFADIAETLAARPQQQ